MRQKGRFVTFEGGEGAGKSTQIALLAAALRQRGLPVLITREPGGSPGAESIRALLVTGEAGRWDATSEALLNFAARRDHLVSTIWPALDRGEWVLCDRFADSTLAYQGYGGKMRISAIRSLYKLVVGDFAPDLTLILDLPVSVGLQRAMARGGGEDRYERMGLDFHKRLRRGFLAIAKREPRRCAVIPADQTIETVQAAILSVIETRLGPVLP
jgi:dTMP kinase